MDIVVIVKILEIHSSSSKVQNLAGQVFIFSKKKVFSVQQFLLRSSWSLMNFKTDFEEEGKMEGSSIPGAPG